MAKQPPFGKIILLCLCGGALAFFSCLGALTGSNSAMVVGGTGFVIGLIGLLVGLLWGFYHVIVWLVDRISPPSPQSPPSSSSAPLPTSTAAPGSPPPRDAERPEPPQNPQG
jgi:hypothetical protein